MEAAVTGVDKDGARNARSLYPLVIASPHLKPANIVLEQEGNGTIIAVFACSP